MDSQEHFTFWESNKYHITQPKLDCGLDQSQTVMAGETTEKQNLVKIGAYQTPVGLEWRPIV